MDNNEVIADIKEHLDMINESLKCISDYKRNGIDIELTLNDVYEYSKIDENETEQYFLNPYRIEATIKQVI